MGETGGRRGGWGQSWSMGGVTGIDDLDTVAQLDYLCDGMGEDTTGTGVALTVAMDAG